MQHGGHDAISFSRSLCGAGRQPRSLFCCLCVSRDLRNSFSPQRGCPRFLQLPRGEWEANSVCIYMLIITLLWRTFYIFEYIFPPLGIPPCASSFTEGTPERSLLCPRSCHRLQWVLCCLQRCKAIYPQRSSWLCRVFQTGLCCFFFFF